jgi:DNA-binding LacI/PurR family transcriptional regulator
MQNSIQIGLAISYSYNYYRGVVRGIRSYAETRPNWLFTLIVPEEKPARTLSHLKLHGLICSIDTEALALALRSWRRPLVDVAAVLPDLRLPRVGVDNDAVGRLAA